MQVPIMSHNSSQVPKNFEVGRIEPSPKWDEAIRSTDIDIDIYRADSPMLIGTGECASEYG
jgi:hypothetical protein